MIHKYFSAVTIIIIGAFFGFYAYMPFHNRVYVYNYIDLLMIAVCAIFLAFKRYRLRIPKMLPILEGLVGLWVLAILKAVFVFQEPISSALLGNLGIPTAFVYYLTAHQMYQNREHYDYFVKTLITGAGIASALALFTALRIGSAAFTSRNYRLTVASTILMIGFLLCAAEFSVRKENRRKLALVLLLCVIHIIFLGKTRSRIVMSSLTIIYVLLFQKIKNDRLRTFLRIATIFAGLAFVALGDFSQYSYENALAAQNWSLAIRYKAVWHYMEQFFKNPILGVGYALTAKTESGLSMWKGTGTYYVTDVGVIGFLFVYGLVGAFWLVKSVKTIWQQIETKDISYTEETRVCCRIIFTYMLITSMTLIFTDNERIFYLPLLLLLIDRMQCKQ